MKLNVNIILLSSTFYWSNYIWMLYSFKWTERARGTWKFYFLASIVIMISLVAAQCKLYRRENSVRISGKKWRVSSATWPRHCPGPGLWLVQSDHVTWILASDWSLTFYHWWMIFSGNLTVQVEQKYRTLKRMNFTFYCYLK